MRAKLAVQFVCQIFLPEVPFYNIKPGWRLVGGEGRLNWQEEPRQLLRAAVRPLAGLVATGKRAWPRGRDVRKWAPYVAIMLASGREGLARCGRWLAALGAGWWQNRRRRLAGAGAVALVVVVVVAYAVTRPNAVVVEVEGRPIGVARSEAVVRQAVVELEMEMAAQGWVKPANYRTVGTRPVRAAAVQVLPEDVLRTRLREALAFNVEAVAIRVNGRPVVWVKDRATAEGLVAAVRNAYAAAAGGKIVEIRVEEKIDYLTAQVKTSEVATPEEALQLLKEGIPLDKKYVVAAGDSLWSIARSQGMTVEDLRAANPQVKGDFLQIGDELRLVKAEAPLHVVVVREVQNKEELPYAVQLRQDSSLYRGQEKVVQEGKPGLKVVTYRVVERNGVLVSKEEIARQVVQEPVPKIVARGTKRIVVASRGGGAGELGWPVSGQITSGYGYRGREFHGGIDIAASYGSPVRAAAAGTVIYTGRDGGYGRTILIDHGDGLVTRYAHLSRIDVAPGEVVSGGEVIGAVGESGRATGPHLHFEVLVNGSQRNPLGYLR